MILPKSKSAVHCRTDRRCSGRGRILQKNAAEMAVQEVNDSGGIQFGDKKYKIKLIIEDNAGKADQSASSPKS